ncbi:MAG: hypothetical protein R3Y45_02530 [Bacillota bacterium]
MKKLLAIVLVVALIFSMTACNSSSDVVETVAPVVTSAPATEAPTTAAPTVAPTETPVVTETPSTSGGSKSTSITVSLSDRDSSTTTPTTPAVVVDPNWDGSSSLDEAVREYYYDVDEDDISIDGSLTISDAEYTGTFNLDSISGNVNSITVYLPNGTFNANCDLEDITMDVTTADDSFHAFGKIGTLTVSGGKAVLEEGSEVETLTTSGASSLMISGKAGTVTVGDAIEVVVTSSKEDITELVVSNADAIIDISALEGETFEITAATNFTLVIPEGAEADDIKIVIPSSVTASDITITVEYPAITVDDLVLVGDEDANAIEAALAAAKASAAALAETVVKFVDSSDAEIVDSAPATAVIEAIAENTAVTAETLESFLASSQTTIAIDEATEFALEVAKTITIPVGKTLTINADITVSGEFDLTIINKGTLIVNEGASIDATISSDSTGTILGEGIGEITAISAYKRAQVYPESADDGVGYHEYEVMLNDNSYAIDGTYDAYYKTYDIVITLTDDLFLYYNNEKLEDAGTYSATFIGAYLEIEGADVTTGDVEFADGSGELYINYTSGSAYSKTFKDSTGVEYTLNVTYQGAADISIPTVVEDVITDLTTDVDNPVYEDIDITSYTIYNDVVIPSGATFDIGEVAVTISADATLTIEAGATITGSGTITNNGELVINGTNNLTSDLAGETSGSAFGDVANITASVRTTSIVANDEVMLNDGKYSVASSFDAEDKVLDVYITLTDELYLYYAQEKMAVPSAEYTGAYTGVYLTFVDSEGDAVSGVEYDSATIDNTTDFQSVGMTAIYPNYTSKTAYAKTYVDTNDYVYTVNVYYLNDADLTIPTTIINALDDGVYADMSIDEFVIGADVTIAKGTTLEIPFCYNVDEDIYELMDVEIADGATLTNNGTILGAIATTSGATFTNNGLYYPTYSVIDGITVAARSAANVDELSTTPGTAAYASNTGNYTVDYSVDGTVVDITVKASSNSLYMTYRNEPESNASSAGVYTGLCITLDGIYDITKLYYDGGTGHIAFASGEIDGVIQPAGDATSFMLYADFLEEDYSRTYYDEAGVAYTFNVTYEDVETIEIPSYYGEFVIDKDITIPEGTTLLIAEDDELEIPAGYTFVNNGTITNYGTIGNGGTFINNGTITNEVELYNDGTFTNDGTIVNKDELYNGDRGEFTNNGEITNDYDGEITNQETFINNGTITNEGDIDNNGSIRDDGTIDGDGSVDGNAVWTTVVLSDTQMGTINLGAVEGEDETYATSILDILTITTETGVTLGDTTMTVINVDFNISDANSSDELLEILANYDADTATSAGALGMYVTIALDVEDDAKITKTLNTTRNSAYPTMPGSTDWYAFEGSNVTEISAGETYYVYNSFATLTAGTTSYTAKDTLEEYVAEEIATFTASSCSYYLYKFEIEVSGVITTEYVYICVNNI